METGPGHASGVWWALAVAALLGAAAVRVAASTGDLWLDEIWSLEIAARVGSALEIPWLRQSNSHPLTTLFLRWVGPSLPAPVHRLPAILAGVAGAALAGAIGWRRSPAEGLAAMVLCAGSGLMIQYSSEARGYALAVCFTLAGVLALDRLLAGGGRAWTWLLAGSVALGLLSHVTFLQAYLAMLGWSALAVLRERPRHPGRMRRLAGWHALPLATVALYGVPYAVRLEVAGAPPVDVGWTLVQTASLSVGLPFWGAGARVGAGVALALLAVGCAWLAVRREPRGALYLGGVLVLPGASLLLASPAYFSPRFVLVDVALFLLLQAELAGALFRRSRGGAWLYAAALLAFLAGNAVQILPLLREGRGGYRAALELMASESSDPVLGLASDHDFHDRMVFGFHARALPPGRRLVYYGLHERPPGGAEWLVVHPSGGMPAGPRSLRDRSGHLYRLERRYPSAPFSGTGFLLYRRSKPAPEPGS